MERSAVINEKHLLNDWGLHLSQIKIDPASPNDCFIEIMGGAALDLTEVNGPVSYKRRNISLTLGALKNKSQWRAFFSQFLNEYHGKKVKIIFDDDKGFYYIGRAYIEEDIQRTARIGEFEVEINAEPYKYETKSSLDPWEWDPFSFISGIIRFLEEIRVSGVTQSVKVPSGDMLTVPIFHVSGAENLKVIFQGNSYSLKNGRNRYPQIKIGGKEEVNLQFSGTGKIEVEYRGGSL